jgi:hypothetical protein
MSAMKLALAFLIGAPFVVPFAAPPTVAFGPPAASGAPALASQESPAPRRDDERDAPVDHDHDGDGRQDHPAGEHPAEPGAGGRRIRAGEFMPPPPKDAAEFAARLAEDGVTLDLARKEVRLHGDLLRRSRSREYPVEYGIVIEGGFTHEAFCIVKCTPSLLNACFLALGLAPGAPRRRQLREPLPSREEVEAGLVEPWTVLPPAGDRVFLQVRWTEPGGAAVTRAFEDFFTDLRNLRSLPLRGFVYLGSRFDEILVGDEKRQAFMADFEGNILTIHPDKSRADNCLFDVFSTDAEPYEWADVDDDMLPPPGVALEFVFSLLPLAGTRPFEPEPPRPAIALPSAAELVARSKSPMNDGSGAEWLAPLSTRDLADLCGVMKRSRHPELRERCAVALGAAGHEAAVPSLQLMLRFDRIGAVRLAAAYALAEIGSDAALLALVEVVEHGVLLARDDALTALRYASGEDFGIKPLAWRSWVAARAASHGR